MVCQRLNVCDFKRHGTIEVNLHSLSGWTGLVMLMLYGHKSQSKCESLDDVETRSTCTTVFSLAGLIAGCLLKLGV